MNTTDQTKEAPTPEEEERPDDFASALTDVLFDNAAEKRQLRNDNERLQRELADALARERGYREALERVATGVHRENIPCDDPQCGDSTWDHECNARIETRPTGAAKIALAALSANPPAGGVVSDAELLDWMDETHPAVLPSRKAAERVYTGWNVAIRGDVGVNAPTIREALAAYRAKHPVVKPD